MNRYTYNYYKFKKAFSQKTITIIIIIITSLLGLNHASDKLNSNNTIHSINVESYQKHPIHYLLPKYNEGDTYVVVNNNIPLFTNEDISTTDTYELYTELDELHRVGPANALLNQDMMPSEERGKISHIKPSGWNQRKIHGNYLYHRSHLIGYQLSGQNDNPLNLMTGTWFFNREGMLPIENFVAKHLEDNPDSYVRYRVTPLFIGNNLLASGVFMEGFSVDDNGESVKFHVFIPNYLPGTDLNYSDGSVNIRSILDWII